MSCDNYKHWQSARYPRKTLTPLGLKVAYLVLVVLMGLVGVLTVAVVTDPIMRYEVGL